MGNPAFGYMMRVYSERIRNETPDEHKARIEQQDAQDKRVMDAMRKVVGDHNGEEF